MTKHQQKGDQSIWDQLTAWSSAVATREAAEARAAALMLKPLLPPLSNLFASFAATPPAEEEEGMAASLPEPRPPPFNISPLFSWSNREKDEEVEEPEGKKKDH